MGLELNERGRGCRRTLERVALWGVRTYSQGNEKLLKGFSVGIISSDFRFKDSLWQVGRKFVVGRTWVEKKKQ